MRMSLAEFLSWDDGTDARYELSAAARSSSHWFTPGEA